MKIKTKQYDVFFVDDDSEVCSAVADSLKDLGCTVTCFNNAFDLLTQSPKAAYKVVFEPWRKLTYEKKI